MSTADHFEAVVLRGGGRGALNRLVRMARSPGVHVQVDPMQVLNLFTGTGVSIPSGLSTKDFPWEDWRQADVVDAPVAREWFLPPFGSTAS